MNYKFLAKKELEKFLNDDSMSIGDTLRAITSKKFTGLDIKNPSRFQEMEDKDWYKAIEKSYENEQE